MLYDKSMKIIWVCFVDFADSLRYTSALSFGLAVAFLVIAVGISIFKIAIGGIGMPRLFPIITDVASVFELFTVTPVVVTAYLCHFNGMKISRTFVWNSTYHPCFNVFIEN